MDALLDALGEDELKASMLVTARNLGSFCTGVGTEAMLLKRFIRPAARPGGA